MYTRRLFIQLQIIRLIQIRTAPVNFHWITIHVCFLHVFFSRKPECDSVHWAIAQSCRLLRESRQPVASITQPNGKILAVRGGRETSWRPVKTNVMQKNTSSHHLKNLPVALATALGVGCRVSLLLTAAMHGNSARSLMWENSSNTLHQLYELC